MSTKSPKRSQQIDRVLTVAAIVTLVIAWFVGATWSSTDVTPYIEQAFPSAARFERTSDDTYAAYQTDSSEQVIAYVTVGEANGYGGPMKVAVALDLDGGVLGMVVFEHKETRTWYKRVADDDFVASLLGKSYADEFQVGADVDGVTGATYTSRAIAEAVREGSRAVAAGELGLVAPVREAPRVQFGVPEIVLIALFAVGYVGHQRGFKYKKQARWLSMLVGLVLLGFVYTNPLTLAFINKLLLGFWPQWQTHLYWYLLIGGILFVFTVDNKNPYCEWFCPFGAAQECMGLIGGAKVRSPRRYRELLKWLQRGLAWSAILLALLFRNPGLSSYEIFGVLFDLEGSSLQFGLLGIVLVAALFIKRPWCRYLCPLRPVTDLIRFVRNWIKELWQKTRTKPAA